MSEERSGGAAEETESISVVVCSHDERRWEALSRAVASLRAQTRAVDEVIVVVDHNPELLARVSRELKTVVVVENHNPRGLSGARNAGAATAGSALVAFLDDDATAAPDWVERLAGACRDPDLLGAGGRSVPRWLGGRPSWFPEEFLWVVGCTYRGAPREQTRVRNIYGGCFCIRRHVLEELGGFLNELGRVGSKLISVEETELCIRAGRRWPDRGFLYDPDAIIEHDVPRERTVWAYFRKRCFAEGISKARLTRLVGSGAGLASERAHAVRTLPVGVAREIGLGLLRAEPARFTRAGAIVAGLAITAAGYGVEFVRLAVMRA